MNYFPDLWDDFISLLFPRLCHGCGNHLLRIETAVCTECFVLIPRTNFHLKQDNPVAQLFWGRCRLEKAAAFSYYTRDSRIRKLIHYLKYQGGREAGSELGRIYGTSLGSSGFIDGIDMIIPVPLHPSKERKRGFNQSEIIAEGIAGPCCLPVRSDLLKRNVKTATQTRRTRYDRWTNVGGIFGVTDEGSLTGKHVLLVDDVITTGSTLEACANEILKIEGARVSVAALAFSVM